MKEGMTRLELLQIRKQVQKENRALGNREKESPNYKDLMWFLTTDPSPQDTISATPKIKDRYEKLTPEEKERFGNTLREREEALRALKQSGNATGSDRHANENKITIVNHIKQTLGL